MASARAEIVELRLLEGPNLYFPRPAVKLTLRVGPWIEMPEARFSAIAGRVGATGRTGAPGSDQRRRAVARLASRLTKRLAAASDVRLGVRSRPGHEPDEIVVAFPWRHRGTATAAGNAIATIMATLDGRRSVERLVRASAEEVRSADPGDEPDVRDPDLRVVSITGTNGKTTVVRLLAYLVRTARLTVAYSSTDGVYRDDNELVEEGDYSGFAGAAKALQERPDVAVLETARGGILLRGVGVLHNDVAVVTNVSADHLGLLGIRTLDQLAEVKATVTRITRPNGWVVLNADDPRVLAMRRGATGQLWLCSMDPDHPAIRDVLREGGRATVPLDGWMTVLSDGRSHPLIPLVDVPVTMAGISSTNVMNAMQVASAALAVGLPERAVVRGLRSFVLDPERNPGRSNLFSFDGRIVLIDYAHNAAGMDGLIEICGGLRRPTADVWLAICTAGDRSDEILHDFAYRAARGADHLVVAELLPYLRGRDRQDIVDRLRGGAFDGGMDSIDVYADELAALRAMLDRSRRGDVIAVTALAMRREVFTWLEQNGGRRLSPAAVKRIVTASQPPRSMTKRVRRTPDRPTGETVRASGPGARSAR